MKIEYIFDSVEIPSEEDPRGYFDVTIHLRDDHDKVIGFSEIRVFGIDDTLTLAEAKVEGIRRAKELLQQMVGQFKTETE